MTRLKRAVAVTGGLILLVVAVSLSYRAYVRHERAAERAIRSADGIDSLEAVRIGGLDQWIHVRGEHTKNPVLLFLHGGPGAALIGVAGRFQTPWEKHFTIVQWDQRGAGKTYARNDRELQRRTMTVRQMQQDTLDMANYLRRRFEREKIVVLGASWGGVPGLWLAHEHPDVVAAYVGVGQAVDLGLNTKTAYEDALAVARTRGLNDAVHELEALRPYPDPANLRKASAAQEWQAELLGPPADRPRFLNIPRLLSTLLTAPEYSLHDVYGLTRGQIFSLELLVPEVSKLNLTTLGSDFRVPAFFFHGRFDPYTRPALIEAYARTVTAPHHELVWFERAGHFPFYRNSSCSPTNCSGACARLSTPSDHGSSKIGSDRRPSGGAAGGRSPLSLDLCFGSLPSAARRPRCPVAPCGWDIRTIEHIETVDRSTPRTPQIEALLQGREAGESDTRPLAQASPSPHSPYAMRSTPRVTIRA